MRFSMLHGKRQWIGLALLGTLMMGGAPRTHATDIYISAEFKPDVQNPNQREFTNTTPWSGVCNSVHLPSCISNNWWSIDMKVRGTKHGDGVNNYGRGSFFIAMPGPRTLIATSEDGTTSHTLDLAIIGAAMRVIDLEQDGGRNPASLGGPSAGCRTGLSNGSAQNYSAMRMFLRHDGGQGVHSCSLHWLQDNNFSIRELDLVYNLTTPEPLSMRSGVYHASTTYTVGGTGDGADFDLGDGVELDDRAVTVHLTLTVQHAFRLDLPAGSDRAVLAPKGGWTQWSDHGIVPASLERELPFMLSSSGQFGVSLRCQHLLPDGRCAIRNVDEDAADAPLDIRLTLPGFHDSLSGRDAVDIPLTTTMPTPVFTADAFIIRRPSQLHFAVNGEAVRNMLDHPGSHYRGDVTVIFDASP